MIRLLMAMLAVAAAPAWSQGGVAAAAGSADAMALLQRVYTATNRLSYSGMFVYQQGQQMESSRITRLFDSQGLHEKLESLEGVRREVVRTRDQVVCYLPGTQTKIIDRNVGQRSFPAMLTEQFRDLADYYTIRRGDQESVAGFDCQVLILEPKDRMRYGHKLWIDNATGMLIKARTVDETGAVVEQFQFTQLRIGGIERDRVRSRFAAEGKNWRVEDSGAAEARLEDAGWVVRGMPAGFRKVTEMTRRLGGSSGVGHIVFSDGLAAVSVFIEPAGARSAAAPSGASRQGAINVYTRRVANHWVTAIGETPVENVRQMANAVEYRRTN